MDIKSFIGKVVTDVEWDLEDREEGELSGEKFNYHFVFGHEKSCLLKPVRVDLREVMKINILKWQNGFTREPAPL